MTVTTNVSGAATFRKMGVSKIITGAAESEALGRRPSGEGSGGRSLPLWGSGGITLENV
jgi:hypothetical protein